MAECVAIGVDIGSTTWKAVAIDAKGGVVASKVENAEPLIDKQTERVLSEMRAAHSISANVPVGATGYGRKRIKADRILTEITCHAKGAFFLTKKPGVLVDIGGQDTKIIHVGDKGEVLDFAMNDKCAAGTGRFLEVILGRLHVPFGDIGQFYKSADKAIPISNTCTVFAESEVISLVAQGEEIGEIVRGLHVSLASRVSAMAGRLQSANGIYMSGGVALNDSMVSALSDAFGKKIQVLDNPQLVGALGAALSVA